jgi:hypothetical protein
MGLRATESAVSVWLTLRRQLVFFLLGALLGALIVSAAKPDRTNDLDIKLLQVDIAHLEEKVAAIAKRQDDVLAWINASDKQKVQDAELEGRAHAKIDASERINWLIAATVLALVAELVVRKVKKA